MSTPPPRRKARPNRGRDAKIPPERRETYPCTPCGKRSWESRQAAKRAIRSTPKAGGESALHAYRCPVTEDRVVWHIGHMGTDKSRAYYREKAGQE